MFRGRELGPALLYPLVQKPDWTARMWVRALPELKRIHARHRQADNGTKFIIR